MLSAVLLASMIIGMFMGVHAGLPSLPLTDAQINLYFFIRLPRILGSAVIGAGLATAGAAYQSAFKNPIVSPGVLGVSAGAGVGAAVAIILGINSITAFACIGALVTVWCVWNIAKIISTSTAYIIVVGTIISGIAGSVLSIIKFLADPTSALPAIMFWLMGSLSSLRVINYWQYAIILVCCIVFYMMRWRLDILYQPSKMVRSLGIDEKKNIGFIVFISTIISAIACSISGVINMVGLAVPHFVRLWKGSDSNEKCLLDIQLAGAIFLVWIDNLIRSMPIEMPIGIFTSLIGGLIFGICTLIRKRRMNK
jgi:iron complex transport system permease protein